MESRALGFVILALLRMKAWAYVALPAGVQSALGRALGFLIRKLRMREKVVLENLERAYPDDPAKRAELFRAAYEHLGRITWEILLLFGPMRHFVRTRAELRGLEHWQAANAEGKGVFFLSSHVGNWEVMAATGAIHGGMDLMLVTKHLKPEWFHRAIERGRARCGVSATYEPRTLRDVLAHLKRRGTVGFVLDQYAGAPLGVRVPVFGIPTGTATVVAMLAKRTGAAVLPVVNYRTPDGRVIVEIRPPAPWTPHENPDFELASNTAAYAQLLERDIREHPEQWLWTHRRFKGDLGPLRPGEWSEGRARK